MCFSHHCHSQTLLISTPRVPSWADPKAFWSHSSIRLSSIIQIKTSLSHPMEASPFSPTHHFSSGQPAFSFSLSPTLSDTSGSLRARARARERGQGFLYFSLSCVMPPVMPTHTYCKIPMEPFVSSVCTPPYHSCFPHSPTPQHTLSQMLWILHEPTLTHQGTCTFRSAS